MSLGWDDESSKTNRVVLALESKEQAESFIPRIQGMPGSDYWDQNKWQFDGCGSAAELFAKPQPRVLILWCFFPGGFKQTLEKVVKEWPETWPVALLVGADPVKEADYEEFAKSLGVKDIVKGPKLPGSSPYTLKEAIKYGYDQVLSGDMAEGAHEKPRKKPAPPKRRKGILVVSEGVKGGIGKSTVAELVIALLDLFGSDTIGIDLDHTRRDLSAFFKVSSDTPGIEQLRGKTVTPAFVQSLLVQIQGYPNVRLLPGAKNKYEILEAMHGREFTAEIVLQTLDYLREMAPVVVVDMPKTQDSAWAVDILSKADYLLTVMDQSEYSEHDAHERGEYMARNGVNPLTIRPVVNRYQEKYKFEKETLRALAKGLGVSKLPPEIRVAANDEAFLKATQSGKMNIQELAHTPLGLLVQEICEKAGVKPSVPEEGKKSSGGILGKFKQMIGRG